MTRQPDQSKPALDLIDDLLASATGKDENGRPMLTVADVSRFAMVRRIHSRKTNGQYTLGVFHKIFGSSSKRSLSYLLCAFADRTKTPRRSSQSSVARWTT